VVCLGDNSASAVLLRAGAVIEGEEIARARRTGRKPDGDPAYREPPDVPAAKRLAARDLARGPARLCQALGIDRSLDGADVCAAGSPLRVRSDRAWPPATARSEEIKEISSGPRVGVSRAAEIPWRFWITGEPTVSVYRPWVPRR
jgi:DNA-3-methyladenine glycosylase